MGPVALRHVGSSQTRTRTRVPCIGRRILNHCATREAQECLFNTLTGRKSIKQILEWWLLANQCQWNRLECRVFIFEKCPMKGIIRMQFQEENRFCELCHHFILPLCKENCILCCKSQYICPQIVLCHSHHHQFSVKMFMLSVGLFQKLTKIVRLKERNFSEFSTCFDFRTKFKCCLKIIWHCNITPVTSFGRSIWEYQI